MNPAAGLTYGPLVTEDSQWDAPGGVTGIFTWKNVLMISAVFVATVMTAWAAAQAVRLLCELAEVTADVPSKWPISIFHVKVPGLRAPLFGWCLSAGILLCFFALLRQVAGRITTNLPAVILLGLVLVVSTNLIHGSWYGLVKPHDGPLQYYHDAVQIHSAGEFLKGFEAAQAGLSCHSRTHPPGAVLFYYGLLKLVGGGAALSIAIAALAVVSSAIFLYRLLLYEFDRQTSGYVTLLFLLIPSVQIYYCASVDAVIAGCCLGVLLFIRHPNSLVSIAGTIACLFCASFLTFGACFLLPVVAGFEIITRRSLRNSLLVLLGVGMLYGALYLISGFDYLRSFRAANTMMHADGFFLLAEPVSYVMTRLESICEIIVFLGPFLLLLCLRGTRTMLRTGTCPKLLLLTSLGVFTLLAMFLTGTFRTGETARICLFIYPYLIFPVAAYLHHCSAADQVKERLLLVVFAQSVAMQTLGGYSW